MKKFMKKFVATAAAVLAISTGAGAFATQEVAAQDKVEIEFWYGLGSVAGQTVEKFIQEFNESQDQYEVVGVQQADYGATWEAVQAGLAGGQAPAMFITSQNVLQNYGGEEGVLADLTPLYETEEFNADDMLEVFVNEGVVEGKNYSVPAYGTTQIMYFNTDVYEAAGVDPDEAFASWENLAEASTTIVENTDAENGHMIMYGPENLRDLAWSNGGETFSEDGTEVLINSPEWVEAWDFARAQIYEGDMGTISGGQGWEYWYQTIDTVMLGTSGSYTGSSGDRGDLDFSYIDARPQPGLNGNPGAPVASGHHFAIPNATEDAEKEAAQAFIQFFTSPEKQAEWSMTIGYVPVRNSVQDVEEYATFVAENPYANVALEQSLTAKSAPIDPTNGVIMDALSIAADEVLLQNVPAQEALDKAQETAQTALDQALGN